MCIIVSVYGHKFLGMLLTFLWNNLNISPSYKIKVYWQDIDKGYIDKLSKVFSRVLFIETHFKLKNDVKSKISSKTLFWHFALSNSIEEDIVFMDLDTLIINDISRYFKYNFDLAFTHKRKEQFPLNTGVILVKNNKSTQDFFKLWNEETIKILNNRDLYKMANSTLYPYGGADQMSLYKLLQYEKRKFEYSLNIKKTSYKCKMFKCEVLNQTNSQKITNETDVIHYKGRWHGVLLNNFNFSKDRTIEDSVEMFIFYIKQYLSAINFSGLSYNEFMIYIPRYLDLKGEKIIRYKYYPFYMINYLREKIFYLMLRISNL